jgi:hypothetical protein
MLLYFYKVFSRQRKRHIKKPLDGRLFYSRAPNENEHQRLVLKQRISRPPPYLLSLHILRPAGLLFPLLLPQAAAG